MTKRLLPYPVFAYDDHLALKPGLGFKLALLFLLRPYAVMAMSFADRREPMALIELFYASRPVFALAAASALPGMLVALAWSRRRPEAGKLVRRLWAHGRALLMVSALGNLGTALAPSWHALADLNLTDIVQAILSLYVLLFVILSQRLRDACREFPAPRETRP